MFSKDTIMKYCTVLNSNEKNPLFQAKRSLLMHHQSIWYTLGAVYAPYKYPITVFGAKPDTVDS